MRSAVLLLLVLGGCSANRQVLTRPEPQGLSAYLASHHPSDILVHDAQGGSQWFHSPSVDGDTLRGVRGRELPQTRLALAVGDVAGIEEPHFSGGKTLGLIGAVLVVSGAALVIALGGIRSVPLY
jgi:hypothetical protein